MQIFGTSGVRGAVNTELTPQFCLELGQAIGTALAVGSHVCLASDTRRSGGLIKGALVSGLLSTGINVTDFGILPTPALALLTRESRFATGIMITASHNPPEFNGVKLFGAEAVGYSKSQEQQIENIFLTKWFRKVGWEDCGILTTDADGAEKYFRFIEEKARSLTLEPRLKLAMDPGNGAACGFAALFRRLGFDVASINDQPDGLFPGRGSEPKKETLEGTVAFLRRQQADLAICFDGDADRVAFCDREGFLGYTEMIAFVSRLVSQGGGNGRVATTIETGRLLDLALADLGTEVIRGRVGDVDVAHLVRERGAAIGVEQVGVYIMPQVGYYPDSFFAVLSLLSAVSDVAEIREFFRGLPRLFFDKAKLECPQALKQRVMERLTAVSQNLGAREINKMDGVRLEFEDSWLLLRASGTEPAIRVLAESTSEERTAQLLDRGARLAQEAIAESSR